MPQHPKKLQPSDKMLGALDVTAAQDLDLKPDSLVEQAVRLAYRACQDFDEDLGKAAMALVEVANTLDYDNESLAWTQTYEEAWALYLESYAYGVEYQGDPETLAEEREIWWPEEIPSWPCLPVDFVRRLGVALGVHDKALRDETRRLHEIR